MNQIGGLGDMFIVKRFGRNRVKSKPTTSTRTMPAGQLQSAFYSEVVTPPAAGPCLMVPPLRGTHPFGRAQQASCEPIVKREYLYALLFGRPTATLATGWMVVSSLPS